MQVNLGTRKVCHEGLQNIISQCILSVEVLKPFASTLGPTSLVTDSTLTAYPTPPSAVEGATCLPPAEAAILNGVSMDERQELSEQGPLDVDTTPSADVNQPPAVIVKDLGPSPSTGPTIEHVEVVVDEPQNLAAPEQGNLVPSSLVGADTFLLAAQDAGIEQLVEKAASEVSVDDTISDEPARTETSDGG